MPEEANQSYEHPADVELLEIHQLLHEAEVCASNAASHPDAVDWQYLASKKHILAEFRDVCSKAVQTMVTDDFEVGDIKCVEELVARLSIIPNVASIHGQYADSLTVLLVLLLTPEARQEAAEVESNVLSSRKHSNIVVRTHLVTQPELESLTAALSASYSVLWSSHTL